MDPESPDLEIIAQSLADWEQAQQLVSLIVAEGSWTVCIPALMQVSGKVN